MLLNLVGIKTPQKLNTSLWFPIIKIFMDREFDNLKIFSNSFKIFQEFKLLSCDME
jgi:hypothetical protein